MKTRASRQQVGTDVKRFDPITSSTQQDLACKENGPMDQRTGGQSLLKETKQKKLSWKSMKSMNSYSVGVIMALSSQIGERRIKTPSMQQFQNVQKTIYAYNNVLLWL